MEATDSVLIVSKKDLKYLFLSFLEEKEHEKVQINDLASFKSEKISKQEAKIFVGVSEPTFNKLVLAGRFKEYSIGKKKYYLRSELLEALRTQSDAGKAAPYKPRTKPTIRGKKTTTKI